MIIPVISEIIEKYQINLLSLSRDYIKNPTEKVKQLSKNYKTEL